MWELIKDEGVECKIERRNIYKDVDDHSVFIISIMFSKMTVT